MGEEKIVICCDIKEEALAETLKTYIENALKGVKVYPCVFPDTAEPNTGGWKTFFEDSRYIFILCSPYSIGQQWINFISGVAALCVVKKEENKEVPPQKIIPLCHSGQKAKDLPHYLYSRQALEIEHEKFLDRLYSIINIAAKCDDGEIPAKVMGKIYQPKNNVEENLPEAKTLKFTLKRNRNNVITISDSQQETGEDLHRFISGEIDEVSQIAVSIGVQYCLFDGEKIFIGLRMSAGVDPCFLSYCKPKGIFSSGYKPLVSWPELGEDFWHNFYSDSVVFDDITENAKDIYSVMQKRALAMGIKFWHIEGLENSNVPVVATMFVNTSEIVPKLEIGVWKYCKVDKKTALLLKE